MNPATIIALIGLSFSVLMAAFGGVVWAIRLEGKAALNKQALEAFQKLYASEQKSRDDHLGQALAALIRFDESTQRQIDEYRTHTDLKIDTLGRDIKAELSKISDKLDGKQDKP